MTHKNIVLIGFMATGKSMTANRLGLKLNRPVISTDALIENKEKMTIPQIFQQRGEAYFRQKEAEIVQQVATMNGIIVDCGGGIVLNSKNTQLLKEKGILINLIATPEVILRRVGNLKNRPLLNTSDPQKTIQELLVQRKTFYQQADFTIDTSHQTPEQTAEEIISLFPHVRS